MNSLTWIVHVCSDIAVSPTADCRRHSTEPLRSIVISTPDPVPLYYYINNYNLLHKSEFGRRKVKRNFEIITALWHLSDIKYTSMHQILNRYCLGRTSQSPFISCEMRTHSKYEEEERTFLHHHFVDIIFALILSNLTVHTMIHCVTQHIRSRGFQLQQQQQLEGRRRKIRNKI